MEFTRIWKMEITITWVIFWKRILTTSQMIHGRGGNPGCRSVDSGCEATVTRLLQASFWHSCNFIVLCKVYRIYCWKFSFKVTNEQSSKMWSPTAYRLIYLHKWKFWILLSHSNVLLQFCLILEPCKPQKSACHPTKCAVINDVKLFPTVYLGIYTVTINLRYPIRCHVTKACTLKFKKYTNEKLIH